jgi:glyoxylase-like metal-dependent hydrolase (beta-lactamase superfamily II)
MSINAFLINTGSRLLLIDTGLGQLLEGRAGGRMMQNLIAAGYSADQVDAVLITHFHVDHVSGLSHDGKAAFPNATIYLSERERAYWLGPEAAKHARPELRGFIAPSLAALKPYLDAGRVMTFEGSSALWDGVHAELTPGHSPGHAIFSISSGNETMSFLGDLVHSREVQFAKPDATFIYDSDYAGAVLQRKQMFARLANSRSWVATAHLSFPGIGHIRAAGASFDWVPAAYSLKKLK